MDNDIIIEVSRSLGVSEKGVTAVLGLLAEGGTIPFIARYRKEATGNLDEEVIFEIKKYYDAQVNLQERKDSVLRLIGEKGLLTDELKENILKAKKLVEVEDLYAPFKEKKLTKGTKAVAKGLKPLAEYILSYPKDSLIRDEAVKYINKDKLDTETVELVNGVEVKKVWTKDFIVNNVDEAIDGAVDIITEIVSDEAKYRKDLRSEIENKGNVVVSLKKNAVDDKETYKIYYNFNNIIKYLKPHQILAFNRGETEKILSVSLNYDQDTMQKYIEEDFIKSFESDSVTYIKSAISEAIKRHIYPSLEREIRNELTDIAEDQALIVFSENLKHLLLQPPLKGNIVLGVDPAFRTGCKLTVIGKDGEFIHKDKIYPHEQQKGGHPDPLKVQESVKTVEKLLDEYHCTLIAIGNGTASRESEKFIVDVITRYNKDKGTAIKYLIVSEAGASVYSASDLAREEFPDFSVEERSAASIARRVLDPLSELVKIDPKSIGVGQYQHDVSPKKLTEELGFVVESAVNQVGVNVNTASKALLTYVSGLNATLAKSLYNYRVTNGPFKNRAELSKVFKTEKNAKIYEQSVGFLRILDGDNPFDKTPIHPESYPIASKLCEKYDITPEMFGTEQVKLKTANLKNIKEKLATELGTDKYTLDLIIQALESPIRDVRDSYPQPILKAGILNVKDLTPGMELEGTVRNVVDFGAFVDIGLHQDGLVHISKMSTKFIKHPSEVLKVGDIITCYVFSVDQAKEKVSLSMIKEQASE